jgi:glutamate/tyrosine decarboxylase-like PLP-dependent enzyme
MTLTPDTRQTLAPALGVAADRAAVYLAGLAGRPVGAAAGPAELRERLGGPLPDGPADPAAVVTALADAVEPGLVASAGPRYFGFVIGGGVPAAVGADWLTSAWDQNAGLFVASPAAAVVEEVCGGWLRELLGLPAGASTGFVTGATMANFTALAAARHAVLARVGWDAERDGLFGAPPVRVLVGAERHATVDVALRYLGFGTGTAVVVDADDQGRMVPGALAEALAAGSGPAIVCAQAGNVNTGALDPVGDIADLAHRHGAWVHVDGAFGLWANASQKLSHLASGLERADSWATDAHKWLNVPYDSGLVFVADPEAHRAATLKVASYLVGGGEDRRDNFNWVPEASRRARAFPVWAALRSLGRSGVADLVERDCALARRFAAGAAALPGVEVANEVVLNQVLLRFGTDEATGVVAAGLQADGTCWAGPTVWHGRAALRVSVSGWNTSEADVDASVAALGRVLASVQDPPLSPPRR